MHQIRTLTTRRVYAMVSTVASILRALGLLIVLGTGCTSPTDKPSTAGPRPGDTGGEPAARPDSGTSRDTATRDTATRDTGAQDTGADTGTPTPCSPPIVLTGNEFIGPPVTEGSWWDELMEVLVCRGRVTDETIMRAGIIYEAERTGSEAWVVTEIEAALVAQGVDEVRSFLVGSPEEAAALVEELDALDVAVLIPVSAGNAYDAWNDSALEDALVRLREERSGGIAGLGPGAMLLAGSSLAGGKDYLSTHVMIDGHTTELDDASDGGSALHDDFLPWIPDATVDVQLTGLGRLVRLAGALARRVDEAPGTWAWGIGLDAQSGIIIQDGMARVVGPGAVILLRPTPDSVLGRDHWSPLVWTDLELDRLTAGWRFDLSTGAVDSATPPDEAEAVAWDGVVLEPPTMDWALSGHLTDEEEGFGTVVARSSSAFSTRPGTGAVTLPGLLGMLDADFYEVQALNHEAVYRALYDHIGHTAVLVTYQGRLAHRADAPGQLRFGWNTPVPSRDDPEMLLERWEPSHVVIDSSGVRWRSLSTEASAHSTAIHPAGLVGLKLHLLAGSDGDGWVYDLSSRRPVRP